MGNQNGKFKEKSSNTSSASIPYQQATPPIPHFPVPFTRRPSVASSSNSSSAGNTPPDQKTISSPKFASLAAAWDSSHSLATTATHSDITLDVQSAISNNVFPAVQQTCNPEMQVASEVKPFLFLGGDQFVARNKEYLHSLKIKHIINCAGLSCENYFEDQFTYTTLDLSDTSKECIFNFMLQTIHDIEACRMAGNNVLVHCVAGISRSATLVTAYLMFIHGYDPQEAVQELRKARQCVDPNPRFMQELDRFRKRLDWQPNEPTFHRIAPHSSTVRALVAKPVFDANAPSQYSKPSIRHLHPRYTLLLHSPKSKFLFLWIGPEAALQAEEERKERQSSKLTRKQNMDAEPYEEAGPRIGMMMSEMDKPFSRLKCQLVHVPTFTDSVPSTGFQADFWALLDVPVGTRVDLEFLRKQQEFNNSWSEKDGDFRYRDSAVGTTPRSLQQRTSVGERPVTARPMSITKAAAATFTTPIKEEKPVVLQTAEISPPATAPATTTTTRFADKPRPGAIQMVNPNAPPQQQQQQQQPPGTPLLAPPQSKPTISRSATPILAPSRSNSSASSSTPPLKQQDVMPPKLQVQTSHVVSTPPPSLVPQISAVASKTEDKRLPLPLKRPVVSPAAAAAPFEEEEESTLAHITASQVLGLFPEDAMVSNKSVASSAAAAVKREQRVTVLDDREEEQHQDDLKRRVRSQSLNFEATSRKLSNAPAPVAAKLATHHHQLEAVKESANTPKLRSRSVGSSTLPINNPTASSSPLPITPKLAQMTRHATAPPGSAPPQVPLRKFGGVTPPTTM